MSEEFVAIIRIQPDETDIRSLKQRISTELGDTPIKISIDQSSASSEGKKIGDELKKSIGDGVKNLDISKSLRGISGGIKNLTTEFRNVGEYIKQIQQAIGSISSDGGMDSLTKSAEHYREALAGIKTELENVQKALSSTNFSVSVSLGGLNPVANNARYGSVAREKAIPQLKQQLEAMEEYLKEYYKVSDSYNALGRLFSNSQSQFADPFESITRRANIGGNMSLSKQMEEYRLFISEIQKVASSKGIDLSPVTSQFTQGADKIVEDVDKIRSGTSDLESKTKILKDIFGHIDPSQFDHLVNSLDEVNHLLSEINTKISSISVSGLQQGGQGLAGITGMIQATSDAVNSFDVSKISNASNMFNSISSSLSGIKFSVPTEQLENMSLGLQRIGLSSKDIEVVTSHLESLGINIKEITTRLRGEGDESNAIISVKGYDAFNRTVVSTVGVMRELDEETGDVNLKTSLLSQTIRQEFTTATEQSKKAVRDFTEAVERGFKNDTFKRQVDDAESRLGKLKDVTPELTSAMNELHSAFDNLGLKKGSSDAEEVTRAYLEYTDALSKAQNQLKINENTQREYSQAVSQGFKTDQFARELNSVQDRFNSIKNASQELTTAFNEYKNAYSALESANQSGDVDKIKVAYEEYLQTLEKVQNQLKINSDTQRQVAETVAQGFNTDQFTKELDTVESRFARIKEASGELTSAMGEYKTAFANLDTANQSGDINEINRAYSEYIAALQKVQNQLKINENTQRDAARAEREKLQETRAGYNELIQSIRRMASLQKVISGKDPLINGAEIRNASEEYNGLSQRVDSLRRTLNLTPEQERAVALEMSRIGQAAKESGAKLEDAKNRLAQFGASFKSSFANAAMYMVSGYRVFTTISRAIRSAYQNVVEIDTAMTELRKVTDETANSYNKFLQDAGRQAVDLGSTITDYINSTADFARLGYNFADAQELAKVANIYSVVGDEINSIDDASQSVISTMAAFNIEASDAMSIVDKFNEVGNNFAISSGGIGEALKRSASSLAAAGNTLDESIALVTAANKVVQNPDQIGTAFKTLTMRIRAAKTELEDAGLDTDGMADSVSKLREEIKSLSGVDIMIDDDTFKSTTQILRELSQVWDSLTDVTRANITELIAGKRQGNIISALMNNFEEVEKVIEKSSGSAGSALKEHSKYLDSVEAKTNQLKASWQALSKDFISSDLVKTGITFLTKFASGIDKIINSLGGIGAIGLGAGIIGLIKNFGTISTLFRALSSGAQASSLALQALGTSFSSIIGIIGSVASLIAIINGIRGAIHDANVKKWSGEVDAGSSAIKELDNLDKVQVAYENAKSAYENGTGSKEAYDSATIALLESLGYEAGEVDDLILKHGNLTKALEEEARAKRENADADILTALSAADNLVKEDAKGKRSLRFVGSDELKELLRGKGYKVEEQLYSGSQLGDSYIKLSSNAREAYETLLAIRELLVDTYGEEAAGLPIFKETNALIAERKDNYDKLIATESGYFNRLAGEAFATAKETIGDLDTPEEFEKYADGIMSALELSDRFKKSGLDSRAYARDFLIGLSDEYMEIYKQTDDYVSDMTKKYRDLFRENATGGADGMQKIMHWFDDLSLDDKSLVVDIGVENAESVLWDLDQWKKKLADAQVEVVGTKDALSDFYGVINNEEDNNLVDRIEAFQDRISKLQDVRANIGQYQSLDAQYKLVTEIPELAPYIGDIENLDYALNKLIDDSYDGINEEFASEIDNLGGVSTESGKALSNLQQMFVGIRNSMDIESIDTVTKSFENVSNAMKSGSSVGGMKPDDINNIVSAFGRLEGYDPAVLFERTTHGVQLNTRAVRLLNKEYETTTKSNYRSYLAKLKEEYDSTRAAIGRATTTAERFEQQSRLEKIREEAEAVANEAAMYDGLVSSYKQWQDATSATDSRKEWETIGSGLENVQELIDSGWVNDSEVIDFMNIFLEDGEKITNWGEGSAETFERITGTVGRYFDGTVESLGTFLDEAMAAQGDLDYIQKAADGSYTIDFGVDGDEKIASLMNDMYGIQLSSESVQYILEALADSNFDIHITSETDELVEDMQSADGSIENTTLLVDELKEKSRERSELNLGTTEAQAEVDAAAEKVRGTQKEAEKKTDLELNTIAATSLLKGIETLIGKIQDLIEEPSSVNVDTSSAMSKLSTLENKAITVGNTIRQAQQTTISNTPRGYTGSVSSPTMADGTAFARGNWGTRSSGIALAGELGQEIVVRDGHWFTVGDDGAEFFRYEPGDIIFNARQSEEILKYGGTRGRGFSYADGTAFSYGSGSLPTTRKRKKDSNSSSSRSSSNNRSSSSRDRNSSNDKEFSETFDWIEVKIARIERAISNLDTKTNSVYRKWKNRNSYLVKEISKVNSEIDIQNKGYDRYIKEANSVGLSKKYRNKVKSGKIDIETIKNEKLAEKIKLYQQWYVHATLYSNVY